MTGQENKKVDTPQKSDFLTPDNTQDVSRFSEKKTPDTAPPAQTKTAPADKPEAASPKVRESAAQAKPTASNAIPKKSSDAARQEVQQELITELQDVVIELQYEMDECRQKLNTTMALLTMLGKQDADWNRAKDVLDAYRHKQNRMYQSRRTQQTGETPTPSRMQSPPASVGNPPVQQKQQVPVQPQKRETTVQNRAVNHTGKKRTAHDPPKQERKTGKLGKLGDILFYVALVVIVGAVIIMSLTSGDGVKTFLGHSVFFVKTSSMEDVYPKGSMIITRQIDPAELQVGDDITFMTNETTTVTHRIISIIEKYEDTGERGFKTQGVMNKNPDKDIVPAANVVGKVIFGNMFLGTVMLFVSNNWPLLVFFAAVILIMILVMKRIFREEPEEDEEELLPSRRQHPGTHPVQGNQQTRSPHQKMQR